MNECHPRQHCSTPLYGILGSPLHQDITPKKEQVSGPLRVSLSSAAKCQFHSWPQSPQLEMVPGVSMIQQECAETKKTLSKQLSPGSPAGLGSEASAGPRPPGVRPRAGHRLRAQQWQLLCVCVCPPPGPWVTLVIISLPGSSQ